MVTNVVIRKIAIIQLLIFVVIVVMVVPPTSPLTIAALILIAAAMLLLVFLTRNTLAEIDLQDDELLLHSFENSPVAVAVMKPSGHLLRVNQPLVELLGYSRSEMVTLTWQQLIHQPDQQNLALLWQHLLDDKQSTLTAEIRFQSKTGQLLWGRTHLYLVRDEQDQPLYLIANIENINSEHAAIHAQRQWEKKFEQLLLPWQDRSASWILNPNDLEIEFFCAGFVNLFGPTKPNATIQHVLDRVHPEDRKQVSALFHAPGTDTWKTEFRVIDQDNNVKHMLSRGSAILDQFGRIEVYIGSTFDISEQVEQKQQLDASVRRLNQSLTKLKYAYRKLNDNARLDSLTALYNRKALYKELNKELKLYRRSPRNACLIFIDINDFKDINDQHGHMAGDKVLQALAQHLREHSRETDVIGRFGGDEVAMLLRESNLEQAQQFHQSVLAPGIQVELETQTILLTLSCGFVQITEQIENVEHWLALADKQMYNDKNRYKARQSAAR